MSQWLPVSHADIVRRDGVGREAPERETSDESPVSGGASVGVWAHHDPGLADRAGTTTRSWVKGGLADSLKKRNGETGRHSSLNTIKCITYTGTDKDELIEKWDCTDGHLARCCDVLGQWQHRTFYAMRHGVWDVDCTTLPLRQRGNSNILTNDLARTDHSATFPGN